MHRLVSFGFVVACTILSFPTKMAADAPQSLANGQLATLAIAYLKATVAQDWQSSAQMLCPASLARRHSALLAAIEAAPTAADRKSRLSILKVPSLEALRRMSPQEAYVADRVAAHARIKVSPETLKRKRDTLQIYTVGVLVEPDQRHAHVLLRTDMSTQDARIRELLHIQLMQDAKGTWLIKPDGQNPTNFAAPTGADLLARTMDLPAHEADAASSIGLSFLRLSAAYKWEAVVPYILPSSMERRKNQLLNSMRRAATPEEAATRIAGFGIKTIRELESTSPTDVFLLEHKAALRKRGYTLDDLARIEATYRYGVIGIVEEDNGDVRHLVVRIYFETFKSVETDDRVITLVHDKNTQRWFVAFDARIPLIVPLR